MMHEYSAQQTSAVDHFCTLYTLYTTHKAMHTAEQKQTFQGKGTGFRIDEPDDRDKTITLDESISLPPAVDLRKWCSPITDQGEIKSCTAHAATGLVEFFQRKAYSKHLDASSLFLYKVTRNLLGWHGDDGAFSRTTMKALALFGVPPEEHWPYDESKFNDEPSAFCYSLASRYRAIEYLRIDTSDRSRETILQQLKLNLAASRPVMFGMLCYDPCMEQAVTTGRIPFPTNSQIPSVPGQPYDDSHNMMAVGYDDTFKITNMATTEETTTGAFLVRNSWGTDWGERGYGWLPYEYVLRSRSMDWWTILKGDWLDTGEFEPQRK